METLRIDRTQDGVVTVTLARPEKKNAISSQMWDELGETFRAVAGSESDRVLVLTGSGGSFCAGADLTPDPEDQKHQLDKMHRYGWVGLALHEIPKPTIAQVNGIAVGAGLNLALGCDLVVAGESARFSEIFARRGLAIDLGGSWLLPRLVGMHKAKELALLGEIIGAGEAERIGIVNRVVPDDELDAFVADWAGRLAAGPPLALQMTKRMLTGAFSCSFSEALHQEAMAQSVTTASQDTREALEAFFAKRTPVFRGR
ncbi:MAG: enoyl-CoA hydratase [Myxococcota bacterium]|nr:enoyl-CoA hydratase [Myxococcota bacterium]